MNKDQMTVRKGQQWRRMGNRYRVLGVVEGYVVYRFKGAAASVEWWRDFEKEFVLVTAE